jgi:hypothetical protein
MAVYVLREVCDVGIGNNMFFATEQHYKNKSNKNGIMTLNCQRTSEDGHTIENVLVKCTDIHPVLHMVVDKALLMHTASSIKKYLNTHIAASFDSHKASTISSLTDSRYVIGVVLSQVSLSTSVDVIFNRTEDAQMLIIACRVFFKQMERATVSFPPPEIPMWVRLHYELQDNTIFKKYRDTYGNWEVVDNFQAKKGWHYGSHFTLPDAHVQFSSKACVDGIWTKILYVEYSNLVVGHFGKRSYAKPVLTENVTDAH